MSRWEFMRQLEELLSDISPSEREEALQYYNDYFNDAGRENEEEVINALGSPEQVARIVKEGLGDNGSQGEFTENGYAGSAAPVQNEIVKRTEDTGQKTENAGSFAQDENHNRTGGDKKEMPTWAIVLIVIACVIFSPAILGLAGAAAGVIVSVIAAVLAIVFGTGLAMLILYVVAIALVVAAFSCIWLHPMVGIGLLGGGFLCAALGILFMLLTVFLAGKCIPGICQGIAYIFKKLFGGKGGAKA